MVRIRTECCHGFTALTVVLGTRVKSCARLPRVKPSIANGIEFRYRCAAEPTAPRNIRQNRPYMRNLLQQRDLDYYRSALLHEARAELERLRQGRSAGTDIERWSQSSLGASAAAEGAATPKVACAGSPCSDPGAVRGK
jgi:hypothetical protein